MQEPEPLCGKLHAEIGNAGDVATGPVEACDEASLHRVAGGAKHDRDRRRCVLGYKCRRHAEGRGDEGDLAANEVGCQFRQAIDVVMRQRNSMATFWPSMWPLSLSPLRKAPT